MDTHSNKPMSRPDSSDRRDGARQPMEAFDCDCGQVLDLSEAGARLRTRRSWKEGRCRPFTLRGAAGEVTLTARCVWIVKDGLFKHTVGLHFENVSDAQRSAVKSLAEQFNACTLGDGYREAA